MRHARPLIYEQAQLKTRTVAVPSTAYTTHEPHDTRKMRPPKHESKLSKPSQALPVEYITDLFTSTMMESMHTASQHSGQMGNSKTTRDDDEQCNNNGNNRHRRHHLHRHHHHMQRVMRADSEQHEAC